MTNVERINYIHGAIKVLEDNMFPVLNRSKGPSLHNQLNRVEVFPGFPIPKITKIGSMTAKPHNMTELKVVKSKRIVVVGADNEVAMDKTFNSKKSIAILVPNILLTTDDIEDLNAIIYNTFIYNINEILLNQNSDYDAYLELYKSMEITKRLKDLLDDYYLGSDIDG